MTRVKHTRMNLGLKNVSNWILANKLSVNVEMTVYLIFAREKKVVPYIPELFLFNKTIVTKPETKLSRQNW